MILVNYKIIVEGINESECLCIDNISKKFDEKMHLSTLINELKKIHNIPDFYDGVIMDLPEIVWKKYKFEGLTDEYDYFHYIDLSLIQLDSEFNFFNNKIIIKYDTGGIGSIMCRYNGVRIFFHTSEKDVHNIPHIHCKYNGIEYRINLNTLEPIDKKLFKNPKLNKKVMKLIEKNQVELIQYWDDVIVNGIQSNFKMYIE